jgi:hypothetical protein
MTVNFSLSQSKWFVPSCNGYLAGFRKKAHLAETRKETVALKIH